MFLVLSSSLIFLPTFEFITVSVCINIVFHHSVRKESYDKIMNCTNPKTFLVIMLNKASDKLFMF